MNFETIYKNLNFHISLETVLLTDITLLLGDKFNRLPNQTMLALKKGIIIPYNLIIKSKDNKDNTEERTHYWSNVLLTSNKDDLVAELGLYLDNEEILDLIVSNWKLIGDESGPSWK